MPALPRASAITRPTRVPPPVTRATRPSISIRSSWSCRWRRGERRDFLVLLVQPLRRHVHHSKPARSIARTVPIGAAARDESKEIGERLQTLYVFTGVAGMPDLDAVESRRDEGLEPLTSSTISWVRPDRQRPRLVSNDDRILDRKPVFRHEGTPIAAQVAHEGITEIVHDSARDQSAGDMGPANSSPIRLKEDRKSTRLNSSHLGISYAVFCLKKKKDT